MITSLEKRARNSASGRWQTRFLKDDTQGGLRLAISKTDSTCWGVSFWGSARGQLTVGDTVATVGLRMVVCAPGSIEPQRDLVASVYFDGRWNYVHLLDDWRRRGSGM